MKKYDIRYLKWLVQLRRIMMYTCCSVYEGETRITEVNLFNTKPKVDFDSWLPLWEAKLLPIQALKIDMEDLRFGLDSDYYNGQ